MQSKVVMCNIECGLKSGSGSVTDFGRKLEYLDNPEALWKDDQEIVSIVK